MSNYKFVRKDLEYFLSIYKMISDCLSGEKKIKEACEKYLPRPNPDDGSSDNLKRYEAYKLRAVFYNVTKRTSLGLLGQVFSKRPLIEFPSSLNSLIKNATGDGLSIEQLAQYAVSLTCAYSRCGLLVDYPATDERLSKKQVEDLNIRPTLYIYKPDEVINWKVRDIGAETVLTLVVIKEKFFKSVDEFESIEELRYRVLMLDELNQVQCNIYEEGQDVKTYSLKDSSGKPLNRIPFSFIGSENNDSSIDWPNFYDLAILNIAHYRNSADYEESAYVTGQATPVITGLSESWYTDILKSQIRLGSYGGIPLPENANATLLQAAPNSMVKEAMDAKERQMVALGAKLVEQKSVQRTATEATIESASENSILCTIANNVSEAFEWGLNFAAKWIGESQECIFKLNTDFAVNKISAEERRQLVEEWQRGAITFSEMREGLRASGVATLDDNEASTQIIKEKQAEFALVESIKGKPEDDSKPK